MREKIDSNAAVWEERIGNEIMCNVSKKKNKAL